MPGPAHLTEWLKHLKRTEQLMLATSPPNSHADFLPVNPHTCQSVRPSSERTLQNSREPDELQGEGESDIEEIGIAVPKRQSARTDPVPVPKTPAEDLDDPGASSNEPTKPKVTDEAQLPLRRSRRTTAGKHGNLHNEPRSTVNINSLEAFHLVNLILRTLKTNRQN